MTAQEHRSCDWEENEDGWWNTDCGNAFGFTDGSPIYNEFRCCPYCGKTLTETPYSDDEDSSANANSPDAGEKGKLMKTICKHAYPSDLCGTCNPPAKEKRNARRSAAACSAGRRKPYTEIGITRLPCYRCGERSKYQWQVCADDSLYRPLCAQCDVELNRMVLRWMGDPKAEIKVAKYAESRLPNDNVDAPAHD